MMSEAGLSLRWVAALERILARSAMLRMSGNAGSSELVEKLGWMESESCVTLALGRGRGRALEAAAGVSVNAEMVSSLFDT